MKETTVATKTKLTFVCNECMVNMIRKDPEADTSHARPCTVYVGDGYFDNPTECIFSGEGYEHPAVWRCVPSEYIPHRERDYSHLTGKEVIIDVYGNLFTCIVAFCDYHVGITISGKGCKLCLNGPLSVHANTRYRTKYYPEIFPELVRMIVKGVIHADVIEHVMGERQTLESNVRCATGL